MGTFPAEEAAKLFPREKGYNFTVVAMDGGAHVELWKGTTRVGKFAVSPLPGCGGTLVFHDSEIDSTCRNRGHGVFTSCGWHGPKLMGPGWPSARR